MVTVATGATLTVIADVPVFVSLVAVMVTGPPADTAVTKPVWLTVATASSLELHLTGRPRSVTPLASSVTAESCWVGVIPNTRFAAAGLTVTLATGTGMTVITGVGAEVTDSLAAVMVAVPTFIAVTVVVPVAADAGLTVNTVASLESQLTVRSVTALPVAS